MTIDPETIVATEVTFWHERRTLVRNPERLALLAHDLDRRYWTLEALADKYGTTPRSIYRDIQTLQGPPWNMHLNNRHVVYIPSDPADRDLALRRMEQRKRRERNPKYPGGEAPDDARVATMRARAVSMGADGADYTTGEHLRWRWEMWGGRCYLCGAEAQAIDHVIPLARGGANWPANLRPICGACNSRKGSKWPYPLAQEGESGVIHAR